MVMAETVTGVIGYTLKKVGDRKSDFVIEIQRTLPEEAIKSPVVKYYLTDLKTIAATETIVKFSTGMIEDFSKTRQRQLLSPALSRKKSTKTKSKKK